MTEPPLIVVEGLWKKYSRSLSRSLLYGAADSFNELFNRRQGGQLRTEEFWAIQDVSFELRRGQSLALVGQNGAGKSTLLKLVAGILKPDRGRILLRGRLEKVMNFGAGFQPRLTGRENVRLRARLAGIREREIPALMDEIVSFAEVEEFADSPLEFYSSGMRARLGFAASVMSRPDILIIDEALAVGDLGFKMKCYDRLGSMMDDSAVLFVSHSMNQVSRICNLGCYVHKGEVKQFGDVQETIRLYNDCFGVARKPPKALNEDLLSARFTVGPAELSGGDRIPFDSIVTAHLDTHQLPDDAVYRIIVRDLARAGIQEWSSQRAPHNGDGGPHLTCALGTLELSPGRYTIEVIVMAANGRDHLCITTPIEFAVDGDYLSRVPVQRIGRWSRGPA